MKEEGIDHDRTHTQASPRRWGIGGSNTTVRVIDERGRTIATIKPGEHDLDNARLIITAVAQYSQSVNAYDANQATIARMRELLERTVTEIGESFGTSDWPEFADDLIADIRAALEG